MAAAKQRPPGARNAGASSRPRSRLQAAYSSPAWELVKSIIGALLIYLVIRTFFVEAYRIPSASMEPTLLVGDWLFVNKLVYGPRIPFTHVHLPGYRDPQRGDVVVFVSPPQIDQPEDPTPTLVKRLIGMPGDTIYMRNAMVYIDGIAQRQGYGAQSQPGFDTSQPDETSALFSWQQKYALRQSRFGPAPATPTHDNWGPLVIPPRHYMMLGDNRYNSKDSRYWGLVPRNNIKGRPMFVYYSYNAEDSDRPLPFITDIRWSRIGHWIR